MRARHEQAQARRHTRSHAMRSDMSMRERALEMLLQAVILLLAVGGFLFCLLSCYQLTVLTARAVWTALSFCALVLFVYTQRRYRLFTVICLLLMELLICLQARELMQGLILLLEQALTPMQLYLPEMLSELVPQQDAQAAAKLTTLALQALLFPVAMLAGFFIIRRPSVTGLALSTLPLLFPAPFYTLTPATAPAFCLICAYFMLFALHAGGRMPVTVSQGEETPALLCREAGKSMQSKARRMLALAMLPLVALSALLSCLLLPERGYVRPESVEALQQRLLSVDLLDLTGTSNDGLTQGKLRRLSEIRYSGETALKLRVSYDRPLYLRDFAGTVFSGDSWDDADDAVYARVAEDFLGIPPQNLHAAAAAASGVHKTPYTLSVRNVAAIKGSLFVPNGLITRAEDIAGAAYARDTALTAGRFQSVPDYTVEALPMESAIAAIPLADGETDANAVQRAYLASAGSAFRLSSAANADARQAESAAQAYLAYIFSAYAALPEETRLAAAALCDSYGLALRTENGALDIAATCRALYGLLSERCTYSYAPARIPADADFVSYFINESRSGYCVHFATAATVLLRSLGLPARYAEGYIVVHSDYAKPVDEDGFIDIDDTHAHAWVEIFDPAQLDWIPVEMTPGSGTPEADAHTDEAAPSTPSPSPSPTPSPTPTPAETPPPSASPSTSEEPPEANDAATPPAAPEAPMPPDASDGFSASDAEGASSPEGRAARLPLWARIALLLAALLTVALTGVYSAMRVRCRRLLSQPDANEAVLYACRLALTMLRFAGVKPLQALQTPEAYALYAGQVIRGLPVARLEALLLLAQRVRFSATRCNKQERIEASDCLQAVFDALCERLPWVKRALFKLRFPGISTSQVRRRTSA